MFSFSHMTNFPNRFIMQHGNHHVVPASFRIPAYTHQMYIHRRYQHMQRNDMLIYMRYISRVSSAVQMSLLLLVMFAGVPGLYDTDEGFMYISDNFCSSNMLAGLFMLSTLPTWSLLACSVATEQDIWKQRVSIWLIALPLPFGVGIVFFSICVNPLMHYVYVNAFIGSVGCVHLTVAYTADHFEFIQTYAFLTTTTAICGIGFMCLALFSDGPGVMRDTAVLMEYTSVIGFIILNSFSADRIREHMKS